MKDACTSGFEGRLKIIFALAASLWSVSSPAHAYTVRADRPRLFLTPAILTRLRAEAAANSPRWLSLKNVCDSYMAETSPYLADMRNYALAYQITGNPAYADKAISLAQLDINMGMAALNQAGTHGYDVRSILPEVATVYDWCYDRFTPAQRAAFRAQLEAWADWVWPETNPSRVGGWSVDNPGDNFYHGFMMTWMVGLALSGDSPKAAGYVAAARRRWETEAAPYLSKYGAGGYSLEGTNYGTETYYRIFWYLEAHHTATGEDLFNAPGFTWPREAITAKLYLTTPGMDRLYPGGDQPRDRLAPLSDYARSSALVALSVLDSTTAGYARWWLDHTHPNVNTWRWRLWEQFLWYRSDVEPIDYTAVLPRGYLAPGAGWMTSRSDWGPDATYVSMMCGPTRESHQDLAQNGFMIFRREWLAASARLAGGYGILRGAADNNTITIGGLGQPGPQPELPKDLVKVIHFADTDQYAYFAGEAKDAYTFWKWPNAIPVLNGFRRHLLFLKPHRVVIFDRIDAVDASQVKTWHLNTLTEPTVTSDSYQSTVAGVTLFGKTLQPPGGILAKVPINQGPQGALSSWRVDVSAPTGKNLDLFLNVLETAPATQTTPTPVQAVQTGRGSLVGAEIGDQVVVFDGDEASSLPLDYRTGSGGVEEHYVMNRQPGKWYQVTVRDPAGSTAQQMRVQATQEGMLLFRTTTGGAHAVSVRDADAANTPLPSVGAPTPAPNPSPQAVPTSAPVPTAAPVPTPSPAPQPQPVSRPAPAPVPQPQPVSPPVPTPAPQPGPVPPPAPRIVPPPLPPAAFGYIVATGASPSAPSPATAAPMSPPSGAATSPGRLPFASNGILYVRRHLGSPFGASTASAARRR
jgi:hypothetical protein